MLTMTLHDTQKYSRANLYAMMMFRDAGLDYVACRCCTLNWLFTGLRLGSEAVEKLLKAFIFLKSGAKSSLTRNDRHNPYLLKEELKKVHSDPQLDKYDSLLNKLFDHYQSRYWDNPVTGKGASTAEVHGIDDLFIYLTETLPMPDEVKYRTMFFVMLCDEGVRQHWRAYEWITKDNRAIQGKLDTMNQRYQEVFKRLYPT